MATASTPGVTSTASEALMCRQETPRMMGSSGRASTTGRPLSRGRPSNSPSWTKEGMPSEAGRPPSRDCRPPPNRGWPSSYGTREDGGKKE